MSKYSGFINGTYQPFVFKPHGFDGWKKFYLGTEFIALLVPPTYKPGWSVIVNDVEDSHQTPTLVEGFVSRHAAIDYALKVCVKTRDTYNRDRADHIATKAFLEEKAKADEKQKRLRQKKQP
ncbi:hypothetical protein AD45P4_00315 [Alteromonas phage vB_AmaP_AD45-P4]|nr:hypothetical protein AD45P4_00315 [Alteromonas phage vB_AmaP_AD45-P4]